MSHARTWLSGSGGTQTPFANAWKKTRQICDHIAATSRHKFRTAAVRSVRTLQHGNLIAANIVGPRFFTDAFQARVLVSVACGSNIS